MQTVDCTWKIHTAIKRKSLGTEIVHWEINTLKSISTAFSNGFKFILVLKCIYNVFSVYCSIVGTFSKTGTCTKRGDFLFFLVFVGNVHKRSTSQQSGVFMVYVNLQLLIISANSTSLITSKLRISDESNISMKNYE